jgi:hypothetical protein
MSEASRQPLSRRSGQSPAEPSDRLPSGRKRSRRIAPLAVLAALALGAVGCGGDDDGEGAGTTAAGQPQQVTVEVKDAEPVGGIVRADIKQGTEVMLKVTSDVEDEVHVHGYDLSAEVAPGQPAHISFLADIAGEFEVELEERTVPIAELAVAP